MDIAKIDRWAELLLDIGKKNSLINYRDTKSSTLEVLVPDAATIFSKAADSVSFEVYDPKIEEHDEEEAGDSEQPELSQAAKSLSRDEYINTYKDKVSRGNRLLLYNAWTTPVTVLKSIEKKGRMALEETGVNIMHLAFGFVHWKEKEYSNIEFLAPVLLIPVEFINESAVSPHFIKANGDETVVNPTFNYKLKSEYNVELPSFEDEELDEYLSKVSAIVDKLGFTVSNECRLGSFAFLKINMYKDLKSNKEKILANGNVKILLDEKSDGDVPEGDYGTGLPEDYHLSNPIIELNSVVDADSSQIEAIEMAKAGYSFVLQGPPGTGKSQTITNIIAECLADGKKILFVSEKQAALNVVYDKLKKAGLSEFCLELHSHKANKKAVIEELCHTLNMEKTEISSKADDEIRQKEKAQNSLDLYDGLLHKKRDVIEKSLYQLFDGYSSCREAPDLETAVPDIGEKNESFLFRQTELLEQYVDYIPSIGYDYRNNPWYGYSNTDNSFEAKNGLRSHLSACNYAFKDLAAVCSGIREVLGLDIGSYKSANLFGTLFEFISKSETLTPALLERKCFTDTIKRVEELKNSAAEITAIENAIDEDYEKDAYELPAEDIHKRLTKIHTDGLARTFNSDYKQIITDMRLCRIDGRKPSYQEAVETAEKLKNYRTLLVEYNSTAVGIENVLGKSYTGYRSDWEKIAAELELLQQFYDAGIDFSPLSSEDADSCRSKVENALNSMKPVMNETAEQAGYISKYFKRDMFDVYGCEMSDVIEKLDGCIEDFDGVDNWYRFTFMLNGLETAGLLPFLQEAIDGEIDEKLIPVAYKKTFYRQWIEAALNSEPELAALSRIPHDKFVELFTNKDKLQFEINKARIKRTVSAQRPNTKLIAAGSAVSMLLREGEKKRKQKPIRNILDEAGELVQLLKPCFLMSPLSVSTYLTTDKVHFDVVVFDEASQIFPQDAIGSIYRADQLIVVGDSKQMPPSNFFNAMVDIDESDEEIGDVTDFESILDLCSASMMRKRLQWHYRSRYEPLIAFSNFNFYDNELITFPSSENDKKGIGVDYYYVEGQFDHKTHTNRIEAEYIVNLVYENLEKYPERSLGVVAFSVAQQNLIDKLLDKRRIEHPEKEEFFRLDLPEPFFVKNLETVQGDERDTIIFSIAYGYDKQGRFLQNFGPLNREGGERRLNVAVTRAKSNVQVVASIHHTDIELNEKTKEGSKLLRAYLDYAEHGVNALERIISVNPFDEFDSEFEMEVCDFLRKNGFEVDTQIGCSGFKIDLGLKRNGSPDYVLAIECDGSSYHSSKNARDRDRLRQQVLENMGWRFYRIWSTDWYLNRANEKTRLLEAVRAALNDEKPATGKAPETDTSDAGFEESLPVYQLEFPKYRYADMKTLEYKYSKDRNFMQFILDIMKDEAPISEEWLLKRICGVFGREKVTSVVTDEYSYRMRNCRQYGIIRKNGFLYSADTNKYMLRVPDGDDEHRELKYICLEELASGMYAYLRENVSVDRKGLYRSIIGQLGYSSLSHAMEERLDEALTLLKKKITVEGETVSIN